MVYSSQPWRCLWRGFVQITSTLPCRRMILQFSQIRLTLARTFMIQQLHAGAGLVIMGKSRYSSARAARQGRLRKARQVVVTLRVTFLQHAERADYFFLPGA